jgi:hypothetical protein
MFSFCFLVMYNEGSLPLRLRLLFSVTFHAITP